MTSCTSLLMGPSETPSKNVLSILFQGSSHRWFKSDIRRQTIIDFNKRIS